MISTLRLRSLRPTTLRCLSTKPPVAPTSQSRTTPKTHSGEAPHPGFTPYETPATSAHPSQMPAAEGAIPSSTVPQASTKPHPPHPDVSSMASGASSASGGSDAVKAGTERNVKGWGPNARSADFNPEEGRRKAVLDGGSNEAKGPQRDSK